MIRADPRRGQLVAVAALTVLAALLRFATLDRQSFWSDEAMTALLARMSFTDMLGTIGDTESTPPLYYVLAWVWAKAFGHGEIGLRSLSALAGTATVPVTFLAGTTLVGRRAGVAAAGFVAVSPLLVWYSQEARAYALAVLLCGISFAALTYVLERATVRSLTVWAAASVLAIASHYFALFVVAAEVVWLLLADRRPSTHWAAGFVTAGAAGVSLLALEQRGNGLVDVIAMSAGLGERVQVLAKQLLIGSAELPADRALAGVVALIVAASVVLVVTRGTSKERRAFTVAASVGGAAVIVPVALAVAGLDYVNTRNAQVGMVPLAIAAAAGLAVVAPRRVGMPSLAAVAVMLLAIAMAVTIDPAYGRSNWRGFARSVTAGDVPRAVVVTPDHQGWFARVPLQIYLPHARAIDEGLVPQLAHFERVSRRAEDRKSPERVVVREVVLAAVGWDDPVLPQPLPESFAAIEETDAHGYRFVRFRSDRPVPIPTTVLAAPNSAVLLER
jgi:hypothetical protein